jgi:hypothetical protein
MKTKSSLNRIAVLAAVVLAPVLTGCYEDPLMEKPRFLMKEGLLITSGKFTFTNEFEPVASEFAFSDYDGDCETPAENTDEILLLPHHHYECVFTFTGEHVQYKNVKVHFSMADDLDMVIAKSNQENQLFEGQITEWTTGSYSDGEMVISLFDAAKGCYSIRIPVKIIAPDLD